MTSYDLIIASYDVIIASYDVIMTSYDVASPADPIIINREVCHHIYRVCSQSTCDQCTKVFNTRRKLKDHVKFKHALMNKRLSSSNYY